MLELVLIELIKSAVSIAKDILGDRVKEKNKELLEKKIKREDDKKKSESEERREKREGLTDEEKSRISLLPAEEVTAEISLDVELTQNKVTNHIDYIKAWCGFIGFKDLQGEKRLSEIYVELDTYLMPLRTHYNQSERQAVRPLQEAVFSNDQHAIILGQPGAGKTTSMKKLCSNYFNNSINNKYNFPILIRFRDLNLQGGENAIINFLIDLFRIRIIEEHIKWFTCEFRIRLSKEEFQIIR